MILGSMVIGVVTRRGRLWGGMIVITIRSISMVAAHRVIVPHIVLTAGVKACQNAFVQRWRDG